MMPKNNDRSTYFEQNNGSARKSSPSAFSLRSGICATQGSSVVSLVFATCIVLVALTSCSGKGGRDSAEEGAGVTASQNTLLTDGNDTINETLPSEPRYFGRYAKDANGVTLGWPGSGFLTTFTGSSLSATLQATHIKAPGPQFDVTVDVTVDGQTQPKLTLSPNQSSYVLAQNLAGGSHTVALTKLTEANVGIVRVSAIAPASGERFLAPPARKKRRIEVIADSEMTGYGVEAQVTSSNMCLFTATTQNVLLSVPAQLGRLLGAEVNNVSYSGKGITRNLSTQDPVNTLPVIYSRPVPDDTNYGAWDFSLFPADVVVLDAGGNDLEGNTGSGKFADPNQFIKTYVSFIEGVRKNFPQAPIFCVLSSAAHNPPGVAARDPNAAIDPNAVGDRNVLAAGIAQAVNVVQAQGDPNVFYFDYFSDEATIKSYDDAQQALSLGFGCDYHPSTPGSLYLANKLAAAIQAKMKW